MFFNPDRNITVWEVATLCIKRKGCENSFFSSLLPTDEGSTCHQKGAFTYLVLPDAKKFKLFVTFKYKFKKKR